MNSERWSELGLPSGNFSAADGWRELSDEHVGTIIRAGERAEQDALLKYLADHPDYTTIYAGDAGEGHYKMALGSRFKANWMYRNYEDLVARYNSCALRQSACGGVVITHPGRTVQAARIFLPICFRSCALSAGLMTNVSFAVDVTHHACRARKCPAHGSRVLNAGIEPASRGGAALKPASHRDWRASSRSRERTPSSR